MSCLSVPSERFIFCDRSIRVSSTGPSVWILLYFSRTVKVEKHIKPDDSCGWIADDETQCMHSWRTQGKGWQTKRAPGPRAEDIGWVYRSQTHKRLVFPKKRPYLSIDRGGIIVGSSSCYTLAFDLTSPDVILSYNETGCYRVLVASGTRSV